MVPIIFWVPKSFQSPISTIRPSANRRLLPRLMGQFLRFYPKFHNDVIYLSYCHILPRYHLWKIHRFCFICSNLRSGISRPQFFGPACKSSTNQTVPRSLTQTSSNHKNHFACSISTLTGELFLYSATCGHKWYHFQYYLNDLWLGTSCFSRCLSFHKSRQGTSDGSIFRLSSPWNPDKMFTTFTASTRYQSKTMEKWSVFIGCWESAGMHPCLSSLLQVTQNKPLSN